MEEIEKEECGCCEQCNCGEDCNCTKDNKCCDECTCDNQSKCHEKQDCNEQCECDESVEEIVCDDYDEESVVEDDEYQCDENEADEEENCDGNNDKNEHEEKCQCGCGESVEESTADAYFKQLLSLRAEFDNYRKRTQNDISKAYQNGFNEAITQFIPALDSFKMATEYITDPNTLMGIQYIEKGILTTLEKIGVQVIDTTGKFDPNFHQAIGGELSPEHESGDIIKECFKGFKVGDKVIRYAQVIVAK